MFSLLDCLSCYRSRVKGLLNEWYFCISVALFLLLTKRLHILTSSETIDKYIYLHTSTYCSRCLDLKGLPSWMLLCMFVLKKVYFFYEEYFPSYCSRGCNVWGKPLYPQRRCVRSIIRFVVKCQMGGKYFINRLRSRSYFYKLK